MGERPVVFDGDVGTGEGEEGGGGDGGREEGEKGAMEERSGASCSGENLGVGMDGRSGAGRLVGGFVRCSFRGQQKEEGREERRNLMHVLEEDLDFVQLDQEVVTLLYLGRE